MQETAGDTRHPESEQRGVAADLLHPSTSPPRGWDAGCPPPPPGAWRAGRERARLAGMCELRHPIVRLRQLLDAGWSQRRVQRALRSGELARVRIGVYAWPEACTEARLAAKHGGALACVTAARHRGLWVLEGDRMPHVWMRPGQRTYDHPCDCTEHWDAAGPGDDRREPSLARILRQILTCRGGEAFFVALESARRQDLLVEGTVLVRRHAGRLLSVLHGCFPRRMMRAVDELRDEKGPRTRSRRGD